jgi:large subunit ribosomal protein L21
MYAIVRTGGKQYRVEQGQSLLVERLPVDDGGKLTLEPLLYVDGSNVVDGEDLAKVKVEARVVAHERGPKLRVVKFKPKRGYKRRTGHRQELTRIEVTAVKLAARRSKAATPDDAEPKPRAARTPKPVRAAAPSAIEEAPTRAATAARAEDSTEPAASKPATRRRRPAAPKPPAAEKTTEEGDGT